MQLRNYAKKYSIHEILIQDDDIFDALENTDENIEGNNKTIFIRYCYEHLDEFNKCITILIDAYADIYAQDQLIHFEEKLLTNINHFESELEVVLRKAELLQQETTDLIKYDYNKAIHLEIYSQALNQIKNIHTDINNSLITIATKTRSISQLILNLGLPKIQQRLVFCINMLLSTSYTPLYTTQDLTNNYSQITQKLGEFWFNEGMKLSTITEGSSYTTSDPERNLLSLTLFLMGHTNQISALEKICYEQILKEVLKIELPREHSFDLRKFSEDFPHEYIKLYEFLFKHDHLLSHWISIFLGEEHIFIKFKVALLELYVSLAYQKADRGNFADNYSKSAKEKFLYCLTSKSAISEELISILTTHYNDVNLHLDVYIKLAIFYYQNVDHRSLIINQKIYTKIHAMLDPDLFYIHDQLYALFNYWVSTPNDPILKAYAIKILKGLALNKDELALEVIEINSVNDEGCAIAYADFALTNNEAKQKALTFLLKYQHSHNSEIAYYIYLLTKRSGEDTDYKSLIRAGQMAHIEANNEIRSILNDTNNKNIFRDFLVEELNSKPSLFIFNLLKPHFGDISIIGKFDVVNFALDAKIECETAWLEDNTKLLTILSPFSDLDKNVDHTKVLKFYGNLIQFIPNQKVIDFAFSRLIHYVQKNDNSALDTLMSLAKKRYQKCHISS